MSSWLDVIAMVCLIILAFFFGIHFYASNFKCAVINQIEDGETT